MSLNVRLSVLSFAALLTLFLALAQYGTKSGVSQAAAPGIAPAKPAAAIVKAKKKSLNKIVAKKDAPLKKDDENIENSGEQPKKRGEGLRDKGEALVGGKG